MRSLSYMDPDCNCFNSAEGHVVISECLCILAIRNLATNVTCMQSFNFVNSSKKEFSS